MLKAILFDAYGTLISTGDGSVKAAKRILERNKRPDISPDQFYARWKGLHRQHTGSLKTFMTEENIFRLDLSRLYREYGLMGDADLDVEMMLETLGNRKGFPEVKEVLRDLAQDYMIAVGSTTDTAPLLQDLKRNELEIPYVFTSESMEVYKPEKAFYEKMLFGLGLSPSEALFIGDSLIDDVQGPQSVGIRACWVNRKGAEAGNIRPDFEIQSLAEIREITEKIK